MMGWFGVANRYPAEVYFDLVECFFELGSSRSNGRMQLFRNTIPERGGGLIAPIERGQGRWASRVVRWRQELMRAVIFCDRALTTAVR
ncbi:hypothetical protein BI364_07830 [Acidihalobacter yilgarnensis]|uniref:Uncharacterized protein n=1 Tax=Acidihalobacter yilgarnensis TaxID=2819280 RepID=A0A1D8IN83_9GAMM|nr:hypothetical protein BI364_07830 [Acidihalobacter yilgarnensis]